MPVLAVSGLKMCCVPTMSRCRSRETPYHTRGASGLGENVQPALARLGGSGGTCGRPRPHQDGGGAHALLKNFVPVCAICVGELVFLQVANDARHHVHARLVRVVVFPTMICFE